MAFSAGTFWEVRFGGSDTNNGGGFDPTVAGFATDGAATVATGNSPVFSSASYNFVAGDVNAYLFIKAGTSCVLGWFKIVSVAANKATLDASIGTVPQWVNTLIGYLGMMNTVAGCATIASPSSITWGIDYSQQDNAQFSSSTFAIDATTNTKLTDGTNTIGKNWVGNIIAITSGTGFTVQRVLVSSTTGTAATVDKSLGTLGSTGGVGKLGGALASVGMAGTSSFLGFAIFIKYNASAYQITSASTNVTGGCWSQIVGQSILVIGYNLKRTIIFETTNRPTLQSSGISTAVILQGVNSSVITQIWNIIIDGAALTSIRGFALSNSLGHIINCKAINCTNSGFSSGGGTTLFCETTTCSTQPTFVNCNGMGCIAHDNTVTGFSTGNYRYCIACNNSGASSEGIVIVNGIVSNCIAYNNGSNGIGASGTSWLAIINCIAESNGGVGLKALANPLFATMAINCATYNNSGGSTNITNPISSITSLSSSAFTNAAGGDFTLNNTANAGAAARAIGFPTTYPFLSGTNYLDIGAFQHQDTPSTTIFVIDD